METFRIEKDTMGTIQVPYDAYWQAQTQRSLKNFSIGLEKMPFEVIRAYAYLKRSCAHVNHQEGRLNFKKYEAIAYVCDEIIEQKHNGQFPLFVWQTGSGTQTNMNLNEVISSRASEVLGDDFRKTRSIHPNDDVNMSQSSNDTFPTAMKIATLFALQEQLFPTLFELRKVLKKKKERFDSIIKIGRTHLQDATPLTLGQEFSAYIEMLNKAQLQIDDAIKYLKELPIGATAVGTGLNASKDYALKVCEDINQHNTIFREFTPQLNKFHGLTAHDAEVFLSGALNALASNLMKMANDIRWLSSGPRCGIGELELPENEPGSSIMPGKVNPTQAEAVTMVAVQVMANHHAISMAASQGNFQLNVFKPLIIYNLLQSIRLLSDVMNSFNHHCLEGIEANEERIKEYLNNSLMLVTALNPHIGYEKAAKIAKEAYKNCTTLKDEAQKLGILTAEEFDNYVKPESMILPKS